MILEVISVFVFLFNNLFNSLHLIKHKHTHSLGLLMLFYKFSICDELLLQLNLWLNQNLISKATKKKVINRSEPTLNTCRFSNCVISAMKKTDDNELNIDIEVKRSA